MPEPPQAPCPPSFDGYPANSESERLLLAAVERALAVLREVTAVDDQEELTPLGFHLAQLPVDVRIGKMILYGAIFRCLDPVLTVAGGNGPALTLRTLKLGGWHGR
mgnify:CR=1 FL=1